MTRPGALVSIVMGSQSDWHTIKRAADILTELGVEHDVRIVSAHRTPDRLVEYAKSAADDGFKVVTEDELTKTITRQASPFASLNEAIDDATTQIQHLFNAPTDHA